MSPDVLQDQAAQLQGRMNELNDRIAAKQAELQALQDEKTAVRAALSDIRAAYQAWKGTQP